MPLPEHKIEREFALIALALDLRQHPDKAFILTLNYYEDYMNLADDYKRLEANYEALRMENIKLKSSNNRKSVFLPLFLNSVRGER